MAGRIDVPKKKRKRMAWNSSGEDALLDLWPDRVEELRAHRKNGHIYAKISNDLSQLGYNYSPRDLQVKLHNFTQRYRKEKAAIGLSGESSSTWPHYRRIHQILEGFKTNMYTEVKLESIDDSSMASHHSSSTSQTSPRILLPSHSPPLPFVSPSPLPSPSSSASEVGKKYKTTNFPSTVLEKSDNFSADIAKHLIESEDNENELIEVEKTDDEVNLTSSSRSAAKSKRKRLGWNEGSEMALLHLWSERVEELRAQRKNGRIYAQMAFDLSKLGYTYSSRDVQVKLQNFTQRYKKEKAAMSVSGGTTSTWIHYGSVDHIIGGFKGNLYTEVQLESIDDSSIASQASASNPLASPKIPLRSASPTLPLISPSPKASTSASASALHPEKKKGANTFQVKILEKFETLSSDIAKHLKKSIENEKELIEIEKRKADNLEKIAKDNEELKNAIISFLNKK